MQVTPLTLSACRDVAQVDTTMLVSADEATSDTREMEHRATGFNAQLRLYLSLQYQSRQTKAKCARTGCRQVMAGEYEGMRLCCEHPEAFALPKKSLKEAITAPAGMTGLPLINPDTAQHRLGKGELVTAWVGFQQGAGDEERQARHAPTEQGRTGSLLTSRR